MNIDLLIKMANEIGEFFAGTADPAEAAQAVANHLRRFWEPRMRAQIIRYYEERAGAGMSELARSAVGLLSAASKAAPVTPPDAAPKSADA